MKKLLFPLICLFFPFIASIFAEAEPPPPQLSAPVASEDKNSRDLFSIESNYTLNSDFRHDPRLGDGDSFYSDFSYDHRFLINGKWYFRAGVEYERYEFGGTDNGLPNHLQAVYSHVALEYLVKDRPGLLVELDPGVYFQNRISSDAFDVPWKMYVVFPLKKDKIFGLVGMGGGIYQDPIIAPGGGLVWLFSDKFRLEGVFPKPALVYEPNDDWQVRIQGELVYQSFRTDDVITPLHKLQVHNAVLQYNEDRVGLQASYAGFKPFKISAVAGYTLIRAFDFFRHDVRVRSEPAPYFRLAIDARF